MQNVIPTREHDTFLAQKTQAKEEIKVSNMKKNFYMILG